MSYLKFDKKQLVNLEYSVQREILRSNRAGSYCCTTLSGCNTRKYHGLLVCPIDESGKEKHVLLSSLDETVIQHDTPFNLGIHKYDKEHYSPKGHKYIRDFEFDVIPKTTYRVGGVVLTKERILVEAAQQVLVKYTLEEANSPTTLQFRPFLAFRSHHQLSKANLYANTKYKSVKNGICMKLYDGYPNLHMQFSKEVEFIPVPHWYYNIEYYKEKNRGYDYQEDLFVPGYFEVPIKKGESIVFSASTVEANPVSLKRRFTSELNKKTPRDSFYGCLKNSAGQFFVKKGNKINLIAGYPWYNNIMRQTFIALPGLTLVHGDMDTFKKVLDTQIEKLLKQFDTITGKCGVDTPLYLIWAIQQLDKFTGDRTTIARKYLKTIGQILNNFKKGLPGDTTILDNGLINIGDVSKPLTWMNAIIDEKPVTPRAGMVVEINALWYNAVCYALELAKLVKSDALMEQWKGWPEKMAESFNEVFRDENHEYLADTAGQNGTDWSVRPNQVIATALEYTPLTEEMKKSVLEVARQQLVTPRGLRSLSPRNPKYAGASGGSQRERDLAFHNGSAFPWLLAFFIDGYLQLHKKSGLSYIKELIEKFEEELTEHCIGSVSELYDGNPPHKARGAISQAWNVGALMLAYHIIETFEE